MAGLLTRACTAAGVRPVLDIVDWPTDFDAVLRRGEHTQYLFAFNAGADDIPVGWTGVDLLTGQAWARGDRLGGGQVAVIAGPLEPDSG